MIKSKKKLPDPNILALKKAAHRLGVARKALVKIVNYEPDYCHTPYIECYYDVKSIAEQVLRDLDKL